MSAPLTWGLLATASIGGTVVRAVQGSAHTRFTAVASRDADRAHRFADLYGVPRAFGSYQELLASDVDAVYVALPVALHTEWTVKALQAGKHVLCEKPFAMTGDAAATAFDAADAAGRTAAEGFMWRYHPRTRLVQELVAGGAIGTVHQIRAALSVSAPPAVAVAGEDAVYRIELDRISRAILAGEPLPWGRDDAVEQAATLDALRESARRGAPVTLTAGAAR